MSDLRASIRIAIIDAFSGPLKALGGALGAVQGKLGGVKTHGDFSGKVSKSTQALNQLVSTAKPALDQTSRALGATGNATDAVRQRMEAFSKVAELQQAVSGARKFEREARQAMNASGGSADAAKAHFQAFGKLDALQQQLKHAREFERGVRASTLGAGRAVRGLGGPAKAAGASFAALSRQAIASLQQTDRAVDSSGQHLKAFEKLAELRRAEEGFRRVSRAAMGLGGPLGDADRKAHKLRDTLRTMADTTIAVRGVQDFARGALDKALMPIQKFADYDEALGELESKSGAARNSAEFQAYEKQAKEVGARTKFSPADIVLTQAEIKASGYSGTDVIKMAPEAANLATAGGTPREPLMPDQAAGILTSTLAQFQLTADSSKRVADTLVAGADASRTSVTELSSQLKYVGAMANRLKMTPEQTVANLAILSNKGQDGTTAGTNLTQMLERLIAPTDTALAAFGQLGIGSSEVKEIQQEASAGKLPEIMQRLARATSADRKYSEPEIAEAKRETRRQWSEKRKKSGKHYSEDEIQVRVDDVERAMRAPFDAAVVNEALKKIFETQGSNAMSALVTNFQKDDKGETEYDRLIRTILSGQTPDANGKTITDQKAAIKERTAKGQEEQMSGAWEALWINLGSKFADQIKFVTEQLGNLANSLSGAVDTLFETFPTAAPVAVGGAALAGTAGVAGLGLWSTKALGGVVKELGKKALGLGTSGAAAEGAALAASAGEVAAASAAATEAVAGIGAATTAAATAGTAAVANAATTGTAAVTATAAAGTGTIAALGTAAIAALAVPVGIGAAARATGIDKPVEAFFEKGGFKDLIGGGLKTVGVNETIADTAAWGPGTALNAISQEALSLPRIGGMLYDWFGGSDESKPAPSETAPVPASAPGKPAAEPLFSMLPAAPVNGVPAALAAPIEHAGVGGAPVPAAPAPGPVAAVAAAAPRTEQAASSPDVSIFGQMDAHIVALLAELREVGADAHGAQSETRRLLEEVVAALRGTGGAGMGGGRSFGGALGAF